MHFHCHKSSRARERRTRSFIRYVSYRSTSCETDCIFESLIKWDITNEINPSILLPGKRDGRERKKPETSRFRLRAASFFFPYFFFEFPSSARLVCNMTSLILVVFFFATCSVSPTWKRTAPMHMPRSYVCRDAWRTKSGDIIPIHYRTTEIL